MPGEERINIRATRETKELIAEGARLASMSVSTFMVRAAEAATRTLQQRVTED